MNRTRKRAVNFKRVCRTWHRAGEVKMLVPGVRGSEGREKDKGVVVRRGSEGIAGEHMG